MNNNNVKNVNQNDNKTLMDAPVPSPVKDPSEKAEKLEAETEVTKAEAETTGVTAAAAATTEAMSQQGSAAPAPVTTQSHNGSIAHSGQKPPSVAGTVKPPSVSQGGKAPSLSQGGKPPSLSQGQKPPSAHGSFTNQPQTHTFQPTLPQLPEPLIPLSHPIDTKQEIVENYLNSLPPAGAQNGGMNLSNGSR